MNTQPLLSSRSGCRQIACYAAAIFSAFFILLPIGARADGGTATTTVSSVTVPLGDLDLSTAEGMRVAHDRLQAMAARICADHSSNPSPQLAFDACVDNTLANSLRQIAASQPADIRARTSVTLAGSVSVADLDLSTPEGTRVAHQRLEAMARRLCSELAGRQGGLYQPRYAACVHDTLAGALAQANLIRTAHDIRIAQRAALE